MGAGNKKRYLAVLKFSVVFGLILSAIMTMICYFGAAPLVTAFLEDEQAFQYGFSFSRIYILSGPILGILFIFMNAIQSMGAAIPSLILSVSRQGIIYFPILITISLISNTPQNLALTQPLTDYIAATLSIVLFIIAYKSVFRQAKLYKNGLFSKGFYLCKSNLQKNTNDYLV